MPADRPVASLSLDLDNLWTYLKTHGDTGWRSFPSYLDLAVPRILTFLAERNLKITFFVVGQDAALERNHEAIAALAAAGHEIGNHSFRHEQWLHLYPPAELEEELTRAEEAIESVTGVRPLGFRGPGYSLTEEVLRALARRGYRYDASTLPTYLGPLARAYYFRRARLTAEQRRQRRALFGTLRDGLRPIKPYRWKLAEGSLVEVPVSTLPVLKIPIHVSYLLYLGLYSDALARGYFGSALRLCRWTGVGPSILLHPLDFLGREDVRQLAFFPAMGRESGWKLERMSRHLEALCRRFRVVTLAEQVEALNRGPALAERIPRFRTPR